MCCYLQPSLIRLTCVFHDKIQDNVSLKVSAARDHCSIATLTSPLLYSVAIILSEYTIIFFPVVNRMI